MDLSDRQQKEIRSLIQEVVRDKIIKRKPETSSMPFHKRLIGAKYLRLHSVVHSFNTRFGASIFEPVAKIIAEEKFSEAKLQFVAGNQIPEGSDSLIDEIVNNLKISDSEPNQDAEYIKVGSSMQGSKWSKKRGQAPKGGSLLA